VSRSHRSDGTSAFSSCVLLFGRAMRCSLIVRDGRSYSLIHRVGVAGRRKTPLGVSFVDPCSPLQDRKSGRRVLTDRHSRFISETYPFCGSRLFRFPANGGRFPLPFGAGRLTRVMRRAPPGKTPFSVI
jgi:hypothetical protein